MLLLRNLSCDRLESAMFTVSMSQSVVKEILNSFKVYSDEDTCKIG